MTDWVHEEGVSTTDDGRRIGWLLRGVPGGRDVLWLHGQPGSRYEQLVLGDDELRRHGLRVLTIDRAGYGDSDRAGLDRREVTRDALSMADLHGLDVFTTAGVSMGGVYALILSLLAPDRVERVVLVSGHVLPYDDPAVVADLSDAEQADLALLRRGPSDELDQVYREAAKALHDDPIGAFAPIVAGWSPGERRWFELPSTRAAFTKDLEHGLAAGPEGMIDDGLRTTRPLELDPAMIGCPVRALHGTADSLEPVANLRRLAEQVPDIEIVAFEGMNHFAPWVFTGFVPALLASEA